MKTVFKFLSIGLLWASFGVSAIPLWATSPSSSGDGMLHTIESTTGALLTSVALGGGVTGVTGLDVDPTSGLLYGSAQTAGGGGRTLITIDPLSGAVGVIGAMDTFAGIAFDGSGALYGVGGGSASTPGGLFSVDKTDGSSALLTTLGAGAGHVLGFNPDDGLMYHAFGATDGAGTFFESIDIGTLMLATVATSGTIYDEGGGLAYLGGGLFALGNSAFTGGFSAAGDLLTLTTGGFASFVGPTVVPGIRGLAVAAIPEAPTVALMAIGLLTLVAGRRRRLQIA